MLRIQRSSDRGVVFSLSGRIEAEDTAELQRLFSLETAGPVIALERPGTRRPPVAPSDRTALTGSRSTPGASRAEEPGGLDRSRERFPLGRHLAVRSVVDLGA